MSIDGYLGMRSLEVKDKEIKRLKENLTRMQIVIDGYGKSTTLLDNRNEQLKKEKEWLLNRVIRIYTGDEEEIYKEQRAIIEKAMQQEIKERE